MEISGLDHDLLRRLLAATTLRHRIIADNVANQNTPGYLRKDVAFEDVLRDFLVRDPRGAAAVEPEVRTDVRPGRADGNNVELESELADLTQNRLLYEAYMNVGAMRMELIRAAIENGR